MGSVGDPLPETASKPEPGVDPRRRVVHIDDNPANRLLVEHALAILPEVEVLSASNAEEGLGLVRSRRPALVLLDLHLPDCHGESVLGRLRGNSLTSAIPVVVLTADARPATADRLRLAGADGFLTKPLDIGELLSVVSGALDG